MQNLAYYTFGKDIQKSNACGASSPCFWQWVQSLPYSSGLCLARGGTSRIGPRGPTVVCHHQQQQQQQHRWRLGPTVTVISPARRAIAAVTDALGVLEQIKWWFHDDDDDGNYRRDGIRCPLALDRIPNSSSAVFICHIDIQSTHSP